MKTKKLLLSLFVLALVSCQNKNDSEITSNETSSSQISSIEESSSKDEVQELVFIGILNNSIEAELGEKCDIPQVSAKRGSASVDVTVTVKDSNNNDVEIIGRGTRFIASNIDGYTIIYVATDEYGTKKAEIKVNVSDTVGPVVKFNQDVDNICVNKGAIVDIPTPLWQDNSGKVQNESIKVTYNDEIVNVENNQFVASQYGIYSIEYKASDIKGNTTTTIVSVDCARIVLLNDFDDLSFVWADETLSSITNENAIEGNCLKVTGNNEWNAIAVYPKYYDLSGFDKFQISIYASKDIDSGEEGFYLLNKKYVLSEGLNVITITKDEFASQYENCKIPSSNPKYDDKQYIWFQLKSNGGTVYVDNFVGVFNNYVNDTASPTIDFGKKIINEKTSVLEKTKLTIYEANCYDNSMEDVTLTYSVFTKDNVDITSTVLSNSYLAVKDEDYKIVYTATDKNGNASTKTITVSVEPKAVIADLTQEEYYPSNRLYDVLNNFENTGVDWCVVDKEFVNEHVMNGQNSLKLSTVNADQCVVLKILKNNKVLTTADFEKYEKIQLYVYSDTQDARFDFYGKMYTLNEGPNVLSITPSEILAEIAKASNVYDSTGGFYFQLTAGTVYVDEMIGIYPEGYQEPQEDERPESIKNYYPTDKQYDILQDFETANAIDTWFFNGSEGLSDKLIVNGKSFHVTGDGNYAKLPVLMLKDGVALTNEDWSKYESFKIAIYSEGSAKFCFLNKIYDLEAGYNVITITKDELLEQINSNAECYGTNGYFWCQVNGTNVSLYFDEMIGIY